MPDNGHWLESSTIVVGAVVRWGRSFQDTKAILKLERGASSRPCESGIILTAGAGRGKHTNSCHDFGLRNVDRGT